VIKCDMSALQRVMYNHMQTSGIVVTEDIVRIDNRVINCVW